jgi:hypothetical protein
MMETLATNSNQGLDDLIGATVEVWTIGGDDDQYDTGILEAVELPWIRLNMGRDRIFIFPVHNIRLIKVLDRPNANSLGRTLLRPSAPQQIEAGKE